MLVGITYIVSSGDSEAQAAEVTHNGEVVPEFPRRDVPAVADGRVFAHAQVGNRIFVGGDFQQVRLSDGTIVDQPYLFAYDINSGQFDPNFRPVLNKLVRTLETTQAGDGVYVGGLFTRWDNDFPLRVAKLDAQGNLLTNFGPRASARVQSIVEVGNSVYLAGDFIQVSGVEARGLVKVDRITGTVDTNFLPQLTNSVNGSQLGRRVEVTADGSALFLLHYATSIDGQSRQAVAKFDLGGPVPTLSTWNIQWIQQNLASNCWSALRDMTLSPDGSFLVVAGQGADNPPNCDSVLRYPTAGNATVTFDWSARMYSSVFSLAVSDAAIYAGGHFCGAPRNPIPPGGVSSTWPGTANGCDVNDPFSTLNPSVRDPENAVFRNQMAALDPTTGQALPWNPGSNNLVAVYDLTLIDRGLLAGHDGNRFNNFDVGRSGLFDFAENIEDVDAPTIVTVDPAPGTAIADPTAITGTASDNLGVTAVFIRLLDVASGTWLQPDGTFGPSSADLPVVLTPTGLGETHWSVAVSNLAPSTYEIRGFARDQAGNFSTGLFDEFTIPGSAQCTVALNADGEAVVSYVDFDGAGIRDVSIRRDGRFRSLSAAGTASFTDTGVAPGDYDYAVRWRPGGVVTDVACTPGTFTVPVPVPVVPVATCSVGLNGSSEPVLTWNIEDTNRVAVREAAQGFITTVQGSNTYTVTGADPGTYSYIARYFPAAGGNIDLACTPSPITVPDVAAGPACTAVVNAAGAVELNWTAVPGEDLYFVRDNDGFVSRVENANSYVDTAPTIGERSYVIRYRLNGTTTNLACQPDPLTIN